VDKLSGSEEDSSMDVVVRDGLDTILKAISSSSSSSDHSTRHLEIISSHSSSLSTHLFKHLSPSTPSHIKIIKEIPPLHSNLSTIALQTLTSDLNQTQSSSTTSTSISQSTSSSLFILSSLPPNHHTLSQLMALVPSSITSNSDVDQLNGPASLLLDTISLLTTISSSSSSHQLSSHLISHVNQPHQDMEKDFINHLLSTFQLVSVFSFN